MQGIKKRVEEQDKFIKMQSKKLRDALEKTVSLDGIDMKMELKANKFITKEQKKRYDKLYPNQKYPADMNMLDETQVIFGDVGYSSVYSKDGRDSSVAIKPE